MSIPTFSHGPFGRSTGMSGAGAVFAVVSVYWHDTHEAIILYIIVHLWPPIKLTVSALFVPVLGVLHVTDLSVWV